ncbi:hypothetical protein H0V99_00270 [Candidatus Saccharibacteria bacterium]|nr:hypothetical protein [Candidatus Saccharibacteria bacterium]
MAEGRVRNLLERSAMARTLAVYGVLASVVSVAGVTDIYPKGERPHYEEKDENIPLATYVPITVELGEVGSG